MFISVKQWIIAVLILIALAVILVPMWIHDASRVSIKLQGIPNPPSVPVVQKITQLPEVKLLNSSKQKNVPNAWSLQLGSFADAQQAEQLVAQLRAKNVSTYTETTQNKNATITTVYVGPELTQEGIQKLAATLAQDFKIKGNVVTFTAIGE